MISSMHTTPAVESDDMVSGRRGVGYRACCPQFHDYFIELVTITTCCFLHQTFHLKNSIIPSTNHQQLALSLVSQTLKESVTEQF